MWFRKLKLKLLARAYRTVSQLSPGGVLWISSDGDDRMEPKVKTQKKPVGLPAKPKKIPGPKINPVNLIFQTHKSQAKEIKSSLKEKGIPVTVKPTD